jgi:phosphopantothenoylcysteine decarboxylase
MNGREVVIGVSGGIAAYKSAALVSQLVQAGASVSVVMTAAAEEFIGQAALAALTGRPVSTASFDSKQFPLGAHIELANRGELLCVAPATANFLAKAACGMADDLLSTLYLSFTGTIVIAPAMNCEMWEKAAVQRNVLRLRDDGVVIVDPEEGWLSCRTKGVGRMAEPDTIITTIREQLEVS